MERASLTFMVAPSFKRGTIIRIYKGRGKNLYSLEYQKSLFHGMLTSRHFLKENEVAESWKRELSEAEASKLFGCLSNLQVPVKPAYILGLDGTSYVLVIENGMNKVKYKWWSKVPEGWEGLDEIAYIMMELAREKESSV